MNLQKKEIAANKYREYKNIIKNVQMLSLEKDMKV